MKGFQSQNVPWKALPPLKSVCRLPRDLILHVRFVMLKDDKTLLCTYYGSGRGGTRRELDVLGSREGFRAADGMFLVIGDAECRSVPWHGTSARQEFCEAATYLGRAGSKN